MKKIITLIAFIMTLCGLTFAQSPLVELEKVKEIKLLESTRDDVQKILADYKLEDSDDSRHSQNFSTPNADIEIEYSSGQCSDDSDEWNVAEWKATKVEIRPTGTLYLKNIGFDYSKFRREREFKNVPQSFIYHNKDLGMAFQVRRGEVWNIYLFPTKKSFSMLCDNEERKKFYSTKNWFVNQPLKDRYMAIDPNYPANVVDLTLNKNEIIADCPSTDATANKSCSEENKQIAVVTKAIDPENDVLIYNYQISGGKIIGTGANVIWDLSGVKAGIYGITASVDDSCGVCGKTVTRIVVVKECPNCSVK